MRFITFFFFVVFSLFSQPASAEKIVVKLEFENGEINSYPIYQLRYAGNLDDIPFEAAEILPIGLPSEYVSIDFSGEEGTALISAFSDEAEEWIRSEFRIMLTLRNGILSATGENIPHGCTINSRFLQDQPDFKIVREEGTYSISVGDMQYTESDDEALCSRPVITKEVVRKSVRIKTKPERAEIYVGGRKTGFVTNGRFQLSLIRFTRQRSGRPGKASVNILIRKIGYANETRTITEDDNTVSVNLTRIGGLR